MYIAICEDNQQELDMLTALINDWQAIHNIPLRFKAFRNASDIIDAAKKEHFTLYILDIMMPGINGLEAARDIRQEDASADIVFLTSAREFAYDSYSVNATEYILKPITGKLLFPLLDRLYHKEQKPSEGLTVKCGSTLIRILFSQLSYVEVSGKHLYFNLTDGSVREVFGTLKEYEPILLKRPDFMQVHRSYIVNMMQIEEFSPSGIHTFSGKTIPVSRRLFQQLQKDYLNLLFTK